MTKYDKKSNKAEEFINDTEIKDTISYADSNSDNLSLIEDIMKKAREMKGLSHREAAVLLNCENPEVNQKIRTLAAEIKQKLYGSRIVLFAPLYLSNYCVNKCTYCPYHLGNDAITRKKLTQEEIYNEVIALQDMGHKRLAIELGEDPARNPIEYVLESIKTIYSVKHNAGAIRRVNVNIAATTVENYKKLHEAAIGTYILFQETYHKEQYEKLHPAGPKHDYAYHTESMDRAMDGGIDDVGLGVLFGLDLYKYEFIALLMHAEHLEAAKGVGPHTISVPRVRPATGINTDDFLNAVPDEIFEKIVALIRIAVPYTGMIMSTRESKEMRERALTLGISQISGGSKTSVGGYFEEPDSSEDTDSAHTENSDSAHTENSNHMHTENINTAHIPNEDTAQFEIDDNRTLDEVISWLVDMNHLPSFCTACYREGRTGDTFMSMIKGGLIAKNCHANALETFEEYLQNYASPVTKEKGMQLIENIRNGSKK